MIALLKDADWTAKGVWFLAAVVLVQLIREAGPWRKQSIEAERDLRSSNADRITKLEARCDELSRQLLETTEKHHREIDELRQSYDLKLQVAAEEVRVLKHALANTDHAFDMFVDRVRRNPEDAQQIAAHVAEERKRARERADRERDRVAHLRSEAIIKTAGPKP